MVKGSVYREVFEHKGLKIELEHDMSTFKQLNVLKDGTVVYKEEISIPCWAYITYRPRLQRQLDKLIQSNFISEYQRSHSCKI